VLGCLLVNTRLCFCMHDGYLCVCVVGDGVGLGLEEAWLAVAVVAVCPIFGRGGGGSCARRGFGAGIVGEERSSWWVGEEGGEGVYGLVTGGSLDARRWLDMIYEGV